VQGLFGSSVRPTYRRSAPVSHPNDAQDAAIPVLNEVLVQGDPTQARDAAQARGSAREPADGFGPERDEAAFTGGEATEPIELPPGAAVLAVPAASAAHAVHAAAAPARSAIESAAPTASPSPAAAAHAAAPTAPVPVTGPGPGITDYDANLIAERLRGRFASYLTGEGRSLIEARCHDAFHEHTTRLVSQITREVSMALESELTGWVREAIQEELKHRGGA
jgi:Protein of unknown function (DUF2486)